MSFTNVRCNCGQVRFRLAGSRPLSNVECLCVDCYARLDYCQSVGGPKVPEAIVKRKKGVRTSFYPNVMIDVQGMDNVEFVKIHDEGSDTTMIAECCNTIVAFSNPDFNGNVVGVVPENATVENEDDGTLLMRFHIKDWPEEDFKKIDDGLPAMWNGKNGLDGTKEPPFQKFFDHWLSIMDVAPPSLSGGVPFASLLAEMGNRVRSLDLPKRSRFST